MAADVTGSYSQRAAEYTHRFGSMAAVHPSDRELVEAWAAGLKGRVIDAGCGPGHWTAFLAERGADVEGVDLVPEFVAGARARFPNVSFTVGSVGALGAGRGSVGAILAWYSLIHHEPDALGTTLAEFARVIRPGGGLLLGFFEASTLTRFDHAVLDAWGWPIDELAREVEVAGFAVLEAHSRTDAGHRPHGAIVARRDGEGVPRRSG